MGQEAADNAASGGIAGGEKISRNTLEEAARLSTLKGHGTPEERFWQRQQGQAETIAVGKNYIAKVCTSSGDSHTTQLLMLSRRHQRINLRAKRSYDDS